MLILLATAAGGQPIRELPGLDGGSLQVESLSSGDTILVVWASWSPRCRDIAQRVNALVERWGGRARVVTVNFQEPPEQVRSFIAGGQLRAPVYLDRDGTFSKQYEVTRLPGLLVLRSGEEAYQGPLTADPDSILEPILGSR